MWTFGAIAGHFQARVNGAFELHFRLWGEDGVVVHTVGDIDPGDLLNMRFWLAFELTQAAPQSSRLNDVAS